MASNPYANPYPIKQPTFLFGREHFMQQTIRRLLSRNYQVSQQVVGLTRSGKTSILNCIARLGDKDARSYMIEHFGLNAQELVDLDNTIFVQIDCTGLSSNTEAAFWTLVARQLARAVDQYRSGHSSMLGDVITHGQAISQGFDDVYATFRDLARIDLLVVILFDEFDLVFASLPSKVLENLRFLLDDLSGHIVYATATRRSASVFAARDEDHVSSFIASYFDPTGYIGLLEEHGAEGYIESIAEHYGIHFDQHDIEFALLVGGRHPDLTRIVCRQIFDARTRQTTGNLNYQQISNQILSEFEAFYVNFWPELPPYLRASLIQLVTNDVSDIGQNHLDELAALGLIIRQGYRFSLFSPIFEQFLRREKGGDGSVLVVARPASAQGNFSTFPSHVFVQRNRRFQLALFIPIVITFGALTAGTTALTIGEAESRALVKVANPAALAMSIAAEFLFIGFVMWRLFLFLERLSEKRRSERLRRRMNIDHGAPSADKVGKRDMVLELIIGSLTGVISTLIAALILHFF